MKRKRLMLYLAPTPNLFPVRVPEGSRLTEEGKERITQEGKTRKTEGNEN